MTWQTHLLSRLYSNIVAINRKSVWSHRLLLSRHVPRRMRPKAWLPCRCCRMLRSPLWPPWPPCARNLTLPRGRSRSSQTTSMRSPEICKDHVQWSCTCSDAGVQSIPDITDDQQAPAWYLQRSARLLKPHGTNSLGPRFQSHVHDQSGSSVHARSLGDRSSKTVDWRGIRKAAYRLLNSALRATVLSLHCPVEGQARCGQLEGGQLLHSQYRLSTKQQTCCLRTARLSNALPRMMSCHACQAPTRAGTSAGDAGSAPPEGLACRSEKIWQHALRPGCCLCQR